MQLYAGECTPKCR